MRGQPVDAAAVESEEAMGGLSCRVVRARQCQGSAQGACALKVTEIKKLCKGVLSGKGWKEKGEERKRRSKDTEMYKCIEQCRRWAEARVMGGPRGTCCSAGCCHWLPRQARGSWLCAHIMPVILSHCLVKVKT